MVLSLLEAAKLHASNGDFRKAGLVMAFATSTPLLGAMPIFTMGAGSGSAYGWTEESILATAAFRSLNAGYTAGESKSKPRSEPLKIAGGTIQVDRALVQMMGEQTRTAQITSKAKATAQLIGYNLIHGNPATDATQPDGLANRFPIAGVRAVANHATGAALSMKKLDEALDETQGRGTHILLNRAMRRNITAYLRSNGTAIEMVRDEFGRLVESYDGKPFLISDPVDVDSAYRGLPFNEQSSACSIFILNLGLDALHLSQGSAGMQIEDIGLSDSGILRGHLVEWLIALADEGPRCVTRLTGITDATATA